MIITRLILALMVVTLLAACGEGGTPASSGAGGSPAGGAAAGGESFSFDVSGFVTAKVASPDFSATYSRDELDEETTIHQLWFGGNDDKAISLMFYGDEPPAVGTFTLTSEFSMDPGTVSLLFVDNSEGVKSFIPGSGTVTLTKVGDSYSGSLDATLTGGAVGASEQRMVTMKGTFNEIK